MTSPKAMQERFSKIDALISKIDLCEEILDQLLGRTVILPSEMPSFPPPPPENAHRPLREPKSEEELAAMLAKRISAERLAKGWRQQDLADATGIARPNIARLESGRRVPKISTLQRIGYALGIAVDDLLE